MSEKRPCSYFSFGTTSSVTKRISFQILKCYSKKSKALGLKCQHSKIRNIYKEINRIQHLVIINKYQFLKYLCSKMFKLHPKLINHKSNWILAK